MRRRSLAKAIYQARHPLQLGKQCTKVEQKGNSLTATLAMARRSTAT